MAVPPPFPDSSFDTAMSNVALHMFPDSVAGLGEAMPS
jgi:ubiquinone/menaquinone biosynthesis C-methylase UbiE